MKKIKLTLLCSSIILTIIMLFQHIYFDIDNNNKDCNVATLEELIRLIDELLKNF